MNSTVRRRVRIFSPERFESSVVLRKITPFLLRPRPVVDDVSGERVREGEDGEEKDVRVNVDGGHDLRGGGREDSARESVQLLRNLLRRYFDRTGRAFERRVLLLREKRPLVFAPFRHIVFEGVDEFFARVRLRPTNDGAFSHCVEVRAVELRGGRLVLEPARAVLPPKVEARGKSFETREPESVPTRI